MSEIYKFFPLKWFYNSCKTFRGVARNLLRGDKPGGLETEDPSGVQGQNMETPENTNGAVTKIDLCTHVPPLATPLKTLDSGFV